MPSPTDVAMKLRSWSRQADRLGRIAWWRGEPTACCPGEDSLDLFAREPMAVAADSYSHIVRGCPRCRARLRRLLLTPRSR